MSYDAPPDLLVDWGGKYLLPILYPLNAFGVSMSSPVLKNMTMATLEPSTR